VKRKDLIKKLTWAGYKEVRNQGGHVIFEKDGFRPVQDHRELNEHTARAILKAAGL
jgi:predicted RNA binding protein YcfA (HicA-like mRNA interferase family)